jgi:hypothetical protein
MNAQEFLREHWGKPFFGWEEKESKIINAQLNVPIKRTKKEKKNDKFK